MRIIIFTDSLGRPRPEINGPDKTEYEDTYGYKIKNYFKDTHDVDIIYIDSLDTDDAIYWSQRMVAFRRPDIVVYHLGINDCVPRLFKKKSKSIILNPFFRKVTFDFFLKALSYLRYPITKYIKIVYVKEQKFKKNIVNMINEVRKYNSNCLFLNIGIMKSSKNNKKSYGYNQNIDDYNNILKSIFKENYIDINEVIQDTGLISDGVHLSNESHDKLYIFLRKKLEELTRCVE